MSACHRLPDRYIHGADGSSCACFTAILAQTAVFADRTAVRAYLTARRTNICAVFAPQAASAQDCAISAKFVTIIAQVCAFFADQADIAHKCAISANFITIFAQGCAFFAQPAKTAKVEAIHTVIAIFTHYDAVITGVATGAELLVAFGAGSPAFLAYRDTFGTVHTAAAAQNHIASTLSAGFAVTACTIVTQFACRTVHGIIVYIAGIAFLAGSAFRPMAFQTQIITFVTTYAAAVKATVAKLTALRCGAGIAILTMTIVRYATENAKIAFVTPIISTFAAVFPTRITSYYASPGNTSFAVRTVAIIIYSTLNVHMACFAPVTVVATVSAVLTVVFLEAVAVSAIRAAVITAAADPVISNEFSAKVAICCRIPCICSCWKDSHKHGTAQQHAQQPCKFHFCFHKQFLLVSFRHFADLFDRVVYLPALPHGKESVRRSSSVQRTKERQMQSYHSITPVLFTKRR